MENSTGIKKNNFQKVKSAIMGCDKCFTISDIMQKTNLNYAQCKKYLMGWEELGLIKFSKTTKIYMRLENE